MSEIIHGNCVNEIPKLGKFKLAFLDPGPVPEFELRIATLRAWDACEGVMALVGDDEQVKLWLAMEKVADMTRINWVHWMYDNGTNNPHGWIECRTHVLFYAREGYTRNPKDLQISTAKATRKRATKNPGLRMPSKIWGLPQDGPHWGRVVGNCKERVGDLTNQLPLALCRRVIMYYTNPEDNVIEPYAGAAPCGMVCKEENRRCISIEKEGAVYKLATERLTNGVYR